MATPGIRVGDRFILQCGTEVLVTKYEGYDKITISDEYGNNKVVDSTRLKRGTVSWYNPDSFIGARFGAENQLEVLAAAPSGKPKTKYFVKCHKCAVDSELFGEAIFETLKSSLKYGHIPCGCSSMHKWTSEQLKIRATRKAKEQGCNIISFLDDVVTSHTKIEMKCSIDGNVWNTTSVAYLLNNKTSGCVVCKARKTSKRCRHDDGTVVAKFMATGSFLEGTRFWRTGTNHNEWSYSCPTCSSDEFVQQGLCGGVFTSSAERLANGALSCRCSKAYRWTPDQMILRIKNIATEEGFPIAFVEWGGEYNGYDTPVTMLCEDHGKFSIRLGQLLTKHGCQSCSNSGFNRKISAGLYVLTAESCDGGFCGFGISNRVDRRTTKHRQNLSRKGYTINNIEVFTTEFGETALEIERSLKRTFPRNPQEIDGFKTEATHYHLYEDVVAHVKSMLESQPYQHEGVIH